MDYAALARESLDRVAASKPLIHQITNVVVTNDSANLTLAFGALNQAALTADITSARMLESEISMLEIQLAERRNQRDMVYNNMWDKVKRVRAGVKANYGDDSQQYEMVGGTRTSERKPRARKAVTA